MRGTWIGIRKGCRVHKDEIVRSGSCAGDAPHSRLRGWHIEPIEPTVPAEDERVGWNAESQAPIIALDGASWPRNELHDWRTPGDALTHTCVHVAVWRAAVSERVDEQT